MSLELYNFDSVRSYPVLASQSTPRGRIDSVLAGLDENASLYLSVERCPGEEGPLTIVLAMPVRAVEGVVEGLEIDLVCEEPGCRLFLEGGDPLGQSRSFDCGVAEGAGRVTCRWVGEITPQEGAPERGTMQFHRIRVVIPAELEFARLGLVSVRVLGDVHPVLTGLA